MAEDESHRCDSLLRLRSHSRSVVSAADRCRVWRSAINDALRRLLRPAPTPTLQTWAEQMGQQWLGFIEAPADTKPFVDFGTCEHGHALHELAVDHLGRCRKCRSEGLLKAS